VWVSCVLDFQPNVNDHPQELQEVVELGMTVKGAGFGYPDAPGTARGTVASESHRASIGPADPGGRSGDNEIH
jgi:hypothetical protein